MNGLNNLKKWYSLEEAAKRLSVTFGNEVTIKDVLQLMIENQIGIYWYLRKSYFLPSDEYDQFLSDGYKYGQGKLIFDSGIFQVLQTHGEASPIKNKLWDCYFSENKWFPHNPIPTWLCDSQGNVVVLMREHPLTVDSLEQYQKDLLLQPSRYGGTLGDLVTQTDPNHHWLVPSSDLPKISEIIVTPETLEDLEKFATPDNVNQVGAGPIGTGESNQTGVIQVADSLDKPEVLKRNELIDRYKNIWPTIDNDLRDASRKGFEGLAAAMVENRKGYWFVNVALAWAKDNFKLKNPPANTMANVPSRKITTQ